MGEILHLLVHSLDAYIQQPGAGNSIECPVWLAETQMLLGHLRACISVEQDQKKEVARI